jgi:hypothetical protein
LSPEVRRRASAPTRSASAQRLAIARRVTRELAGDRHVICVLALGSLAQRRCSHDSDIDLAVITDAPGFVRRFDSRFIDGVTVDCDRMSRDDAWSTVQPPRRDLQSLRDATRLGQGMALHDVSGLARELRRAAATLRPAESDMREHIHGSFRTWRCVLERAGSAEQQWDALRSACDSVVYVLLQLSPARYHKPKWVVHDLTRARLPHVAGLLLTTYGALRSSRATARRVIEQGIEFVNAVAMRYDLPDYETTLALGYTEELAAFSYTCRCLADARSLAADGFTREAQYVAKFAARMVVAHAAELDGDLAPAAGGMLPVLERIGNNSLLDSYRAVMRIGSATAAPDDALLEQFRLILRRAYGRCRRVYAVELTDSL